MPEIFVDADGCPVKKEVYKVSGRRGLNVTLVSNSWMRVPEGEWIRQIVVGEGFDAADDWIVENLKPGDIVVTADIQLAGRCLEQGAKAIAPTGKVFTEDSIGDALAQRELLAYLREAGAVTGGPAPFSPQDRSRFLHELDQLARLD